MFAIKAQVIFVAFRVHGSAPTGRSLMIQQSPGSLKVLLNRVDLNWTLAVVPHNIIVLYEIEENRRQILC
jgi:hypothetical protein